MLQSIRWGVVIRGRRRLWQAAAFLGALALPLRLTGLLLEAGVGGALVRPQVQGRPQVGAGGLG